jgi:carbon-monoxide dehydrogenase large subunit
VLAVGTLVYSQPEWPQKMRHPTVPTASDPLGVKGAGEAGAVGAPPAVINAIVDVLNRRAGVRHIDMPATRGAFGEALHRAG